MLQHCRITTSAMVNLKAPYQKREAAPESLWDVVGSTLLFFIFPGELFGNLLLAKSIVVEYLCSPSTIYYGCEDIMQTKLPGEDVHHNTEHAVIFAWGGGGYVRLLRNPFRLGRYFARKPV